MLVLAGGLLFGDLAVVLGFMGVGVIFRSWWQMAEKKREKKNDVLAYQLRVRIELEDAGWEGHFNLSRMTLSIHESQ